MRPRVFICLILLALLCGCLPKSKDWTHPLEPNPRKEDLLFVEDTQFCEGKIAPGLEGEARDKAMADCLIRLGWKRKEKD